MVWLILYQQFPYSPLFVTRVTRSAIHNIYDAFLTWCHGGRILEFAKIALIEHFAMQQCAFAIFNAVLYGFSTRKRTRALSTSSVPSISRMAADWRRPRHISCHRVIYLCIYVTIMLRCVHQIYCIELLHCKRRFFLFCCAWVSRFGLRVGWCIVMHRHTTQQLDETPFTICATYIE